MAPACHIHAFLTTEIGAYIFLTWALIVLEGALNHGLV